MPTQHAERPAAPLAGLPATPPSAGLAPAPRGRPSWSGLLRLSLVAVPVKAYPAVSSTPAVHFHQLHADCGQRIRYEKRCPTHGPVEAAAIARGYEYAPDQYVLVEAEELDRLRPAQDKALLLEHFVGAHQVDPSFWSGRTLYLVPDGVAAQHPYAVLAQAMHQDGQWALGRVVLSGHRQLVLVRPVGRLLALDVLYYPAQVRPATAWEADLPTSASPAEEVHLARQLIQTASKPLDWSHYRDASAEELAALIDAKVAGRPVTVPEEEPVVVLQLLDALKRSVAAAQGSSPPAVAAPPKKPRTPRRAAG